jgi:hypothetical protein
LILLKQSLIFQSQPSQVFIYKKCDAYLYIFFPFIPKSYCLVARH